LAHVTYLSSECDGTPSGRSTGLGASMSDGQLGNLVEPRGREVPALGRIGLQVEEPRLGRPVEHLQLPVVDDDATVRRGRRRT
jgi:hypothetical protein